MDNLSSAFRLRRIALGLTQVQVATAAGVATRTLVSFESGQGRISLANLRRLVAVVGLELTTREASPRPTLDELSQRYGAGEPAPARKRASARRTRPP